MTEVCMRGIDTGFVALGYVKVAILGVVQGITELLPISSTAHMRLVPAVLGWQDPGSAFSAAMQLAALAAVVSYFWSDVRSLAANSLLAIARAQFQDRDLRFSLWIGLATIPIGVAGLLLANVLNTCNSPLRTVSVIGWACVAMAILLGIAEVRARHRRTIDEASFIDAMLVGIAQVGALIPAFPAPVRPSPRRSRLVSNERRRRGFRSSSGYRRLLWLARRKSGSFTKFTSMSTVGRC